MPKALLVTRPHHDPATNYLCFWSEPVIETAKNKGLPVYDLKSSKARRDVFESYLRTKNPGLIFFNGHGDGGNICGHNNQPLLSAGRNDKVTSGAIVYARSCDAGRKLGKSVIKLGTRTFIGYINKFIFAYQQNKTTQPLRDTLAGFFLKPSNLVMTTLLKGHTTAEAHQRSIKQMYENFFKMLSSSATFEEQYSAKWLWNNLQSQVLYGDSNVSI